MSKKYIIVGASAAGVAAAATLKRLDPDSQVTVFSKELLCPYNKCLLVDVLVGSRSVEEITLPLYLKYVDIINWQLGIAVTQLDTQSKSITTYTGKRYWYDELLIATGTSFSPLPFFKKKRLKNVFSFYTLSDVLSLKEYLTNESVRRALVIGAGLSGLECADALAGHGFTVTLVDTQSWPLAQALESEAASVIVQVMKQFGVRFITDTVVSYITARDPLVVDCIEFASGERVEVDMVVMTHGAHPEIQLGLDQNINIVQGAYTVDSTMQTSAAHVYAAGDCTLVKNRLDGTLMRSGTWPDAIAQANVAAHGMLGIQKIYEGTVPCVSSAFYGKKFCCAGFKTPQEHHMVTHGIPSLEGNTDEFSYMRIIKDAQGVVQGFVSFSQEGSKAVNLKRSLLFQRPLE